jgi:glyoxylase I family protein
MASFAEWYEEHLGVAVVPSNYDEVPWQQETGPAVFVPFPHETDYFGNVEKNG